VGGGVKKIKKAGVRQFLQDPHKEKEKKKLDLIDPRKKGLGAQIHLYLNIRQSKVLISFRKRLASSGRIST